MVENLHKGKKERLASILRENLVRRKKAFQIQPNSGAATSQKSK